LEWEKKVLVRFRNEGLNNLPGANDFFYDRSLTLEPQYEGKAGPYNLSSGVLEREPYLVMEFVAGCTLRQQVERDGALDQRSALLVARDLARALGHAHEQGIIHRDVKPENVLLQEGATAAGSPLPWVVKLADLGLARPGQGSSTETSALTAQGMIMGTPATMAPEQFDDPDGLDFRCDIYGLGCVLHHALSGQPAFTGKTLNQLLKTKISAPIPDTAASSGCRPAVARLVAWCLDPERERRPASYDALVEAIDRVLGELEGRPAGVRARRPRALAIGLGLLVLVLVGVLGLVGVLVQEPAESAAPAVDPVAGLADPVAASAMPAAVPPADPVRPVVEPAKATAAPAAAQPPRFGEPQSLWEADFDRRLAAWIPQPTGSWASHDQREDAIFGAAFGPRASASLRRQMPASPWRLSCTLLPVLGEDLPPLRETGLWLIGEDGHSVGVTIQHLVSAYYLTLRERQTADGPARSVGAAIPLPEATAAVSFTVVVLPDRVVVEHGAETLAEVAVTATVALELRVEGGGVEVLELEVAYPLP
jgi:hypothetical protein